MLDFVSQKKKPKASVNHLINVLCKQQLGLNINLKQQTALWKKDLADELHQQVKRKFPQCRVISNGIDQIWGADLVEMQKFSKWN